MIVDNVVPHDLHRRDGALGDGLVFQGETYGSDFGHMITERRRYDIRSLHKVDRTLAVRRGIKAGELELWLLCGDVRKAISCSGHTLSTDAGNGISE